MPIAEWASHDLRRTVATEMAKLELPLDTIAKIWRAGCIIRSQFLGTIAAAFGESATVANLLMAPAFIEMMKTKKAPTGKRLAELQSLRDVNTAGAK